MEGVGRVQQGELRLLELLLLPAHLSLHNREIAVALLEDRVRGAKEVELDLLVLGPAVHPGADLVELHLQFGEIVPARLDALLKAGLLDPGNARLVLRLFLLGTQIEDRLLRPLQALVEVAAARLDLVQLALMRLQLLPLEPGRGAQAHNLRLQGGDRRAQLRPLPASVRETQVPEPEAQPLVADGLGGLPAEAPDLAAHFADHIRHPRQILIGEHELSHRLPPLALVARDARGLLENRAAFLRL